MSLMSYGMKFSLNSSGRLNCQGLGVIKYNGNFFPIVGTKELDMCIRDIELDGYNNKFIVATDTRGTSYDGFVILGTYTSILTIAVSVTAASFAILHFTKKR